MTHRRDTPFKKIAALMALVLASTAFAAQAAPFTILQDDMTYDLNADATYTLDEVVRIQVNDAQGAQQRGQHALLYSESLQTLEVLEAYTTTKDGQRLDVAADKIVVQQLPASTNAPTFSDRRLKVIIFPQVEPGAVLTLHFKRTQLKPELPGVFSIRESFSKTVEGKAARLTVRAPAGLPLFVAAEGIPGGEVKKEQGATREWQWILPDSPAIAAEPGSVDVADISPYVVATTLKDYNGLAEAYMVGAKPAAKVTPAILQLAEELTRTISDKRAQAEALYRWVGANIRYVAIVLGAGGYVPHAADDVLKARYGDCKDHVALLEALLMAKGIASSPVIVNAANGYVLPKAAAVGAFNHVITYIPSLDVYVDSTSGFAPFGVLPQAVGGKTALVTDTGKGKPALVVLPSGTDTNSMTVRSEARINANGSVDGKASVVSRGPSELLNRAILASIPKDQLPQIVGTLLSRSGQNGTGNLTFSDPRDVSTALSYAAEYQVADFVRFPGPGAMRTMPGIAGPIGLSTVAQSFSLPNRSIPFVCSGGRQEESTTLSVPDNIQITSLPKSTTVNSKFGSYSATYSQTGQQITIQRSLELKFPKVPCAPEDYTELRALGMALGQDLRSQILYQ